MPTKSLDELEAENAALREENQSLRIKRGLGGEPTRDRIYRSAVEVLAAKGWDADLRDFTNAAGVGNSTLYRYFEGRDGLVREIVAEMTREVETYTIELMKIEDPRQIFIEWAKIGFEQVRRYGRLAVQVCFPEDVPPYLQDVVRNEDLYRFTGWVVNRCKAEGHCRADESTRSIVRTFFSLCHPHRIRWCAREGLSQEETFRETIRVFFMAYATPAMLGEMTKKGSL